MGSTSVLTELLGGTSLRLASCCSYLFGWMLFLVHLTVYEVNFIYYKAKVTIPFVLQQYKHLKCFIRIKTKNKEKHEYYSMAHHTATSDCIPPVKTSLHGCGIFSFYCIYFINCSLFIAYLRNLSLSFLLYFLQIPTFICRLLIQNIVCVNISSPNINRS